MAGIAGGEDIGPAVGGLARGEPGRGDDAVARPDARQPQPGQLPRILSLPPQPPLPPNPSPQQQDRNPEQQPAAPAQELIPPAAQAQRPQRLQYIQLVGLTRPGELRLGLELRPGRGGLEGNPAVAGEVELGPGVPILLPHHQPIFAGVILARRIAHGQAGGDAQAAGHHHHGRGVVIAIALLQIEEEIIHNVHIGRGRIDVEGVGVDGSQVVLDGDGLIVRSAGVGGDAGGQVAGALGDGLGQIEVGGQRGRIIVRSGAQVFDVEDGSLGENFVAPHARGHPHQVVIPQQKGPAADVRGHRLARGVDPVRPPGRKSEFLAQGTTIRGQGLQPGLPRPQPFHAQRRGIVPAAAGVAGVGGPAPAIIGPVVGGRGVGIIHPHGHHDTFGQLGFAAQQMRPRHGGGRGGATADEGARRSLHPAEQGADAGFQRGVGLGPHPPKRVGDGADADAGHGQRGQGDDQGDGDAREIDFQRQLGRVIDAAGLPIQPGLREAQRCGQQHEGEEKDARPEVAAHREEEDAAQQQARDQQRTQGAAPSERAPRGPDPAQPQQEKEDRAEQAGMQRRFRAVPARQGQTIGHNPPKCGQLVVQTFKVCETLKV